MKYLNSLTKGAAGLLKARYACYPYILSPAVRLQNTCQFRSFSCHIRLQQYAVAQDALPHKLHLEYPPSKRQTLLSGNPSVDGKTITVHFNNCVFKFHSQWLHDAQVDDGPSKDDQHVFTQKKPQAHIQSANVTDPGTRSTLNVTWNDGRTTSFPEIWLRALAPLVAKVIESEVIDMKSPNGWLANNLAITEISYHDIFPRTTSSTPTHERIFDALLQDSSAGIIKIVDLPSPDFEGERNKENTIVTRILKELFGGVFFHPRRGADKTFNVASHHHEDKHRAAGLPNYNHNKILLPHADHAHYTYPARIQGLYSLEGRSENTFVSCHAVLDTFKKETPDLYQQLCTAPMATGRVAHFYNPSMYQATTDTAITMHPGYPGRIKRFRWHPHLTGSLLSPFEDFTKARTSYRKYQEIMRRDSHLHKFVFKPGDLYIWDNFRVLHGRERVMELPRTAVGQTVPEQVVADRYRAIKMKKLEGVIDENWLVHTPVEQLCEMVELVGMWNHK